MLMHKVLLKEFVHDNKTDEAFNKLISCLRKAFRSLVVNKAESYEKEIPLCRFSQWKRVGPKNSICLFFSPDSKFVGILMNKVKKDDTVIKEERYTIYRTSDGSFVTDLAVNVFQPCISEGSGGHKEILGIIDIKSRKSMPWGIAALLHLTSHVKLNLFLEDFT